MTNDAPAGHSLRTRIRTLGRWWNGSLQVKVVTSTLVLGTATILVLGVYLTTAIRDGLYDQRVDQALGDAASVTQSVQERFDAAASTTGTEAQSLVRDLMRQVQGYSSEPKSFVLLRSPNETRPIVLGPLSSDRYPSSLITTQMQETLAAEGGQWWQPISIPNGSHSEPGIVVGETVEIPVIGEYQLYFVYSLAPEQQTLAFVQTVLLAGSIVLLVLLLVLVWVTTRQLVRPVQEAAAIAERIAAGHLDDRMVVRGSDEIARLAVSFNEMTASLQEKISEMERLSLGQRRFVSDVSHELRTPLTTIKMASEVLLAARSDFEPVQSRSAELLGTQLDRFESLLSDLLEISRFDAGAALLNAEDADVAWLVDQVVEAHVPLAERKGVELRVERSPDRVMADVDRRRVERIVRNLIANAIEHADGGPVEVRIGADESAVAVVVRDYGIGMSADEAVHVFDRFWRADPARARTTGGTGLGLAISLEDAHLHGGWLEAWGRPGQGASFRLTLPRRGGVVLTGSPLPLMEDGGPIEAPSEQNGPATLPVFGDIDEPGGV